MTVHLVPASNQSLEIAGRDGGNKYYESPQRGDEV